MRSWTFPSSRIHPPAFSAQDHRQSSIAEAHPARRQLTQPHSQTILRRSSAPVNQGLAKSTPLPGLYSFFCTISSRMSRSSDSSLLIVLQRTTPQALLSTYGRHSFRVLGQNAIRVVDRDTLSQRIVKLVRAPIRAAEAALENAKEYL
jgi:hypothetical protein